MRIFWQTLSSWLSNASSRQYITSGVTALFALQALYLQFRAASIRRTIAEHEARNQELWEEIDNGLENYRTRKLGK
jgi:hypothetical protein